MKFEQIELHRETLFKDAVLSAADTRGMEIIADAQRDADQRIAAAQTSIEPQKEQGVRLALKADAERKLSSAGQKARHALLMRRTELVEAMFFEIKSQIGEFASGNGYEAWVLNQIRNGGVALDNTECADVFVRKKDLEKMGMLKQMFPKAQVSEDPSIRLGGIKLRFGRMLYDLTLDNLLEREQTDFVINSGMIV